MFNYRTNRLFFLTNCPFKCTIIIYHIIIITVTDGPEPGDVRVGSTINEGSVQVFMSGYWVPVATSSVNWTLANAKVVCRQLGYSLTGEEQSTIS